MSSAVSDMLAQAMAVVAFDPESREWFKKHQPKTLEQIETALRWYAKEHLQSAECVHRIVAVMAGREQIDALLAKKD